MNERPTFSPFWHRIRAMKPRLRSHVQITRQHYRGRRWHVVHDPTSNQFYRLNPIAHDLVGMLDGTRDVETAWKLSLAKFGDAAPTQNEVIQLVGQLYSSNLLSVDSTPETEQLLRRGRERVRKKAVQQAIGIMYFKIRLFNPDRLLTACEPVIRPVLNRWGFLAWLALVIFAGVNVLPEWEKLRAGFDNAMSPSNLWLIPLVFAVLKAFHEFGHGVLCKRFGGQVPEFGVMLLVLLPSPYVDASSCWAFKSKWQRIAVGAGGMIFELFLASIAALVWLWAHETGRSGELITQIAYNAMLTASVSTVLFNANPLMRFDGYYMLADYLEVPNLAQRSNKMMLHLVQKYIYRLKNLIPPTTLPGERTILLVYGVLALAYRIFLFITITLYVLGQFFALGLVLAVWTAAAWFLVPVGKFLHWLATSSNLNDHRLKTVVATIAMIVGAVLLFGVIPMPDRRRGAGVVESVEKSGVFFGTDGFVAVVHKRPGDRVEPGDAIVTLENPELTERVRMIRTQLKEFEVQERAALAEGQPGGATLARERIAVARDNIAELERRAEMLVVRAPHAGVIVGGDPERMIGGYVQRGQPVCEVVDPTRLRIAASMDQRQGAWLFSTPADQYVAQIRPVGRVETVLEATNVRPIPAGQSRLPHEALGFKGGGQIEVDPRDESGREAKRPQFVVKMDAIVPESDGGLAALVSPGERVKVRFKLEPRPLLSQWIERLHKEVQGRVKL